MALKFKWLLLVVVGLLAIWGYMMRKTRLTLARTMYGEARGEGVTGMVAVGNVIINRARSNAWFGGSIIEGQYA